MTLLREVEGPLAAIIAPLSLNFGAFFNILCKKCAMSCFNINGKPTALKKIPCIRNVFFLKKYQTMRTISGSNRLIYLKAKSV